MGDRLRLHSIVHYRGKRTDEWDDKWRSEDYSARNLVKGLKGLPFGGNATITVGKKAYVVEDTPQGRKNAMIIASHIIAAKMWGSDYRDVAVIPIPSSSHTNPSEAFLGRRISEAIEGLHEGFKSNPLLYFKKALPKSAGGGTRNSFVIQSNLRADPLEWVPKKAVLIDDVCTTGAHLRAAYRFLTDKGVEVKDAYVVGRTALTRPKSMFKVDVEVLDVSSQGW